MNIQELENEMWMQVRNGRDEVYIKVQDLQELEGVKIDTSDNGRIFVKYDYVRKLIENYKENYKKKAFRDSLKVDVKPVIVENMISKINEDKEKDR